MLAYLPETPLNIDLTDMNSVTQMPSLIRKSFPVGPLGCNCSIIGDPITKEGIVVDPGGDAEKILATVAELGLKITGIIHTHAHLDHFLAAGEIKKATGAPLCLHKDDKPLWDMAEMQCTMMGVPFKPLPDPDQWLQDDEGLCCCNGVALHTPGHTQGSMSFWFEEHNLLLAGDTLFQGSIGRTDLPGVTLKPLLSRFRIACTLWMMMPWLLPGMGRKPVSVLKNDRICL